MIDEAMKERGAGKPDWAAGVKRTADLTPERLEAAAHLADQKAIDWAEVPRVAQEWRITADGLRAKAADLRGDHLGGDT